MADVTYQLPQQRSAEPHKLNRNFRDLKEGLTTAETTLATKADISDFEWTSFTPVITVNSGSAPTVGNGGWYGNYIEVGNMGMATYKIEWGSTSTAGTGSLWYPQLPNSWSAGHLWGSGFGVIAGTFYTVSARWLTNSCPLHINTNASQVGYANPGAWASGNYLRWGITALLS